MAEAEQGEIQVDAGDVVKLMMQFCEEHNLTKTLSALREETQVSLNTVQNREAFRNDILQGNWDAVLNAVRSMTLPAPVLYDLYDQVVCEMVELREVELAKLLLRETEVLRQMQQKQPERFARLEHLCTKTFFDAQQAYSDGNGQSKRRLLLANALTAEVSVAQPGRLLHLLSHALKWQRGQGTLPLGDRVDLFHGAARRAADTFETFPSRLHRSIPFGDKTHPECAAFSPDGTYLVTGSVDGFIEVWDHETGKIRTDLEYQRNDQYMSHDQAVLCAAFSGDSQLLATGSQEGMVKVWRPATGQCVRHIERAHAQGVTAVCFTRDASQLLTGSFDTTLRAHGLKSGKVLKEYRGHKSFVNTCCYSSDQSRLLSGGSDGVVKIWDAKSMDCLCDVTPPAVCAGLTEPMVNVVAPIPGTVDRFIVCTKTPSVHIVNLSGSVVKTMLSGKKSGGNFVAATVSPRGEWVYCAGEDRILYCFQMRSGRLEHTLALSKADVIGLAHHPTRNYVVSYGVDGALRVWSPA
eukprot:TRINITY_DN29043_c0_g1_i1.p1 TRINITY_DN29043_c0_g1~~TRINITY_DN29043_c0_g1_i1.p1  ORF type:complete len:554 (+),score=197.41 TRINITY_DN29043_c0_g1_i1:98-1663(+)